MSEIKLTINGKEHVVPISSISKRTSLSDYIRNVANLRGTKTMCHEGGCGACVVAASIQHPIDKEKHVVAVNSCLVSILSCNDWDITTVEGVGNRKDGYHKIQTRLTQFNGTQCGYCTPGWVLNMYSLTKSKSKSTMKEIENSFASNICRCTGYRPILDAFKSFASDASKDLLNKLNIDIEDLGKLTCHKRKMQFHNIKKDTVEDDWCLISHIEPRCIEYILDKSSKKWVKVYKLDDIFKILDQEGYDSYMLVAGNTGQGVYHIEEYPNITIDISSVGELREFLIDLNLVLAGNMTFTEVMNVFDATSNSTVEFAYLAVLRSHLDLVAHIPVRNIGTIAGNLMLKHQHREFDSDIFLILETVGASITVINRDKEKREYSPQEFLNVDMKGMVILNVKLPPLSNDVLIRTYKIMPRAQNAHAIVNAGFMFKMEKNIVKDVRIVYGGIDPKFVRASDTEMYLKNKNLFNDETVTKAVESLSSELVPSLDFSLSDPLYRKLLGVGLFYKALINICPPGKLDIRNNSGGLIYDRPVSKGNQTYDTDKSLWPLNQPMPKLEGIIQCSGEAKFVNDAPTMPDEAYACFVLSTVARGDIDYVNPTEALKINGVLAFYTHSDIPGTNTFTPKQYSDTEEEILCSGKILYYGQPIGIIVAESEKLCNYAAKKVQISYSNVVTKPCLTIKDAINANRVTKGVEILPTKALGKDVFKVIKGDYEIKGQYHFTMETQCCIVEPDEDSLNVYAATQWMDYVQCAISESVNVPENKINMIVRRLGGGYGAKASRSALAATACAITAKLMNRPTRFVMSIEANMHALGKRLSCACQYEVGVNNTGEIQYAKIKFWEDNGCSNNEPMVEYTASAMQTLYDTSRWHIEGFNVTTDKASNTWCRAPATCEGSAMNEHIIERIAFALKLDPIKVRLTNISPSNQDIGQMIQEFKVSCDLETRQGVIEKYNRDNKWRKRGIGIAVMAYPIEVGKDFHVALSVYQGDGTVAVKHGGIEMGQGINTKLAQVVAHKLRIALDKVSIKHTNNFVAPNGLVTSGSIGSECVCFAAVKACEELNNKLKPYRTADMSWESIVRKAFDNSVNLHTSYMMNDNEALKNYIVNGVTLAEIELDVLTGRHEVLRVDILEDTGQSLSPEIDIGQVEGAFIMGLGYWTSEELKYDPKTGKLLTNRTWTYKPPGAKDIPLDFRVSFKSNSYNPVGVLRSKATGEPALLMAVSVTHGLRQAVESARFDQGSSLKDWVHIENPCTAENILLAINPKIEQYKLSE